MTESAHRPEIERALRFIAANLERPITVADVARAARLSEFHFHRVFHAAVGEPIGRFITRRRLEQSALRLAYEPDRSITDVALSSGYSSASNFSKAFAAHFGCSPSQVRSPERGLPVAIGKLTSLYGKDFRPEELYTLPPERGVDERRREAAAWSARVRFETTSGLDFACLASPGGYDLSALERLWSDLIAAARQLGLCENAVDAWGVPHDSPQITAPELCRYHACVPCPKAIPLPPPLFRGRMSEGRYAVFRYAGEVSGIPEVYRSIYSCWFRESSLAPDDFTSHERYVTDAPEGGRVDLELWFKVRPRR
ncbi:AraC family transcriptional regulator [Sorangium atrum]|uniref:AraC family transcriptional regulator n=1 Tax=Sorangium atrum TaxID=2995308 RepID=A0ABT5C986_9BACT|nr:AraC family transcriptional regulator [Sorangium aterium]MDC0681726.1 AraC family transcriptional regulator [Sorangium aterium]